MKPDSEQNIVAQLEGPQQEEGVRDSLFEPFVGALPAFSTRDEVNACFRDLRDDDPDSETQPAGCDMIGIERLFTGMRSHYIA